MIRARWTEGGSGVAYTLEMVLEGEGRTPPGGLPWERDHPNGEYWLQVAPLCQEILDAGGGELADRVFDVICNVNADVFTEQTARFIPKPPLSRIPVFSRLFAELPAKYPEAWPQIQAKLDAIYATPSNKLSQILGAFPHVFTAMRCYTERKQWKWELESDLNIHRNPRRSIRAGRNYDVVGVSTGGQSPEGRCVECKVRNPRDHDVRKLTRRSERCAGATQNRVRHVIVTLAPRSLFRDALIQASKAGRLIVVDRARLAACTNRPLL